jgi:cyclopropane-fatty-acyl-phospholipid synthase
MLHSRLERLVRVGHLWVTYPNGKTGRYGDGAGPRTVVHLTYRGVRRLALGPQLGLGESYMDGDLELLEGSFWDLVEIIGRNQVAPSWRNDPLWRAIYAVQRLLEQWNDRATARRNVSHHYDLSVELYRRFLDKDMQYSCGYFSSPGMSLEAAQAAKKAHLATKLDLSPDQKVLDIGCGWGGLAIDIARQHQVEVQGITLSTEQVAVAGARAVASGLADRVKFDLTDYRDVQGEFDRIISVGMLEHVGAPNLEAYFAQVSRLLTDDGLAVVHAIGSRSPPRVSQPFIRKHIFPGGYVPSLSQVTAAVENAGLWITDIEILRLHYAETLRHWRIRFLKEREAIANLYDERFCRMWEAYLCLSELGFRYLNLMVFQLQLAKRVDGAPLTRDYIYRQDFADEVSMPRRA